MGTTWAPLSEALDIVHDCHDHSGFRDDATTFKISNFLHSVYTYLPLSHIH